MPALDQKEDMGLFQFKIASGKELEEVFRLRYKVYCEEWGFERPEDHPKGVETDEYDEHSIHFAALRDGQLVGTVRMILNSEKGFPIEKHCKIDVDLSTLDRDKICELSRLAISKEYRRRAEDALIHGNIDKYTSINTSTSTTGERRRRQEIVIGLYKRIYVMSKKMGITHWYAVMARGLYLLLRRMGIFFVPIGPEVFYHGFRTPYLGSIEEMERQMSKANVELMQEFTEALQRGL